MLKLKIKLETLSNENPTEKAINVLTNYEYNLKKMQAITVEISIFSMNIAVQN